MKNLRKFSVFALSLGLVVSALSTSTAVPAAASAFEISSNPVPVFRFYKTDGSHFYTANESEKAELQRIGGGYRYEGIAFYAFASRYPDVEPVYRFYKFREGSHFYTTSPDEYASLVATASNTYRYEGEAYYGATEGLSSVPVFRFYKFLQGVHFYTADPEEALQLEKFETVYRSEGVALDAPTDLYFGGTGDGLTTEFYLPTGRVVFESQGEDVQGFLHPSGVRSDGDQIFTPGSFSQLTQRELSEGRFYLDIRATRGWGITIHVFDY